MHFNKSGKISILLFGILLHEFADADVAHLPGLAHHIVGADHAGLICQDDVISLASLLDLLAYFTESVEPVESCNVALVVHFPFVDHIEHLVLVLLL